MLATVRGTFWGLRQDVIAQQPTGFVTREHPPARRTRDAHRAPVGIGIQRDGDIGADVGSQGEQRVGGAGLLGVRERDGGEVGVRRELRVDDVHVVKAGPAQGLDGYRAAHPVHRGQGHPDRTGAAPHPRRPADVPLDQIGVGGLNRSPRDPVGRRSVPHGGFDLAVGGGDDLDAAVEIHLVSVVGGGVVRRGDLDAGRRPGGAHREGHHRRRNRAGK